MKRDCNKYTVSPFVSHSQRRSGCFSALPYPPREQKEYSRCRNKLQYLCIKKPEILPTQNLEDPKEFSLPLYTCGYCQLNKRSPDEGKQHPRFTQPV